MHMIEHEGLQLGGWAASNTNNISSPVANNFLFQIFIHDQAIVWVCWMSENVNRHKYSDVL